MFPFFPEKAHAKLFCRYQKIIKRVNYLLDKEDRIYSGDWTADEDYMIQILSKRDKMSCDEIAKHIRGKTAKQIRDEKTFLDEKAISFMEQFIK